MECAKDIGFYRTSILYTANAFYKSKDYPPKPSNAVMWFYREVYKDIAHCALKLGLAELVKSFVSEYVRTISRERYSGPPLYDNDTFLPHTGESLSKYAKRVWGLAHSVAGSAVFHVRFSKDDPMRYYDFSSYLADRFQIHDEKDWLEFLAVGATTILLTLIHRHQPSKETASKLYDQVIKYLP
jgi:hypothetical protein